MINQLRHEEYSKADAEKPFVINVGIERTANKVSLEQNWHDEFEIELCTEGEGEVLLDGKRYSLHKGEVVLIGGNILHHTGSKERLVYSCIIPRITLCKAVGFDPLGMNFAPIVHDPVLTELIKELIEAEAQDNTTTLEKCAVLIKILLRIQKEHTQAPEEGQARSRSFESVRRAIDIIRSNYGTRLSLDTIAKSIYMDKYALCREFKHATGKTVTEYINSYRSQVAATMISEGATVSEAARACGFDNMSFFTKTFQKYMGSTPSYYKKHHIK